MALIVLDDVWNARYIEPFRAESPRSRLVFTTRDAGIASGTSAQLLTPSFLSSDKSRAMLASWSGTSVDSMPPSADELIRECAGLALAVATTGARLRDKPLALWDVVLNQLRKADLGKLRQQFPDYPYPGVLRALQVSVDALELKTRERYLALAVMLGDMPIHPLIQRVLWNADEFDALETAEEFVRLALAERDGEDRSIRLHDLLLDYLRAQYPDRAALEVIHETIRLSSHVIDRDPGQFVPQLVGRLLPSAIPSVQRFTETVVRTAPRPWLRPLNPALQPPGTGLRCTLAGHTDTVNAVAVTADGRRAVSASDDRTLKVWDLQSGRELHTLAGHADRIRAVAVTADGQRAVSASDDRTLKVWELESGLKLHTLAGHTGGVSAVAVTPDGRRAASSLLGRDAQGVGPRKRSRVAHPHRSHRPGQCRGRDAGRPARGLRLPHLDRTLKVWELESGRELQTLAGHTAGVNAVSVTPEGRRAVSASDDCRLKVWELESGRELHTLAGHTGWVRAVAVSADGRHAVSASDDRTLKVWELEGGALIATFSCEASVRCCAFASDTIVVAGDQSGRTHILALEM